MLILSFSDHSYVAAHGRSVELRMTNVEALAHQMVSLACLADDLRPRRAAARLARASRRGAPLRALRTSLKARSEPSPPPWRGPSQAAVRGWPPGGGPRGSAPRRSARGSGF